MSEIYKIFGIPIRVFMIPYWGGIFELRVFPFFSFFSEKSPNQIKDIGEHTRKNKKQTRFDQLSSYIRTQNFRRFVKFICSTLASTPVLDVLKDFFQSAFWTRRDLTYAEYKQPAAQRIHDHTLLST